MKNQKNLISVFWVILLCATNSIVSAQIHCLGITQQTNAKNNNIQFYGIEYQSFYRNHNLGMAYSNNFNNTISTQKLNFNFDINLWQFHHAFLKPRFVPFLGVQTEIAKTNIQNEGFQSSVYQNQWFAKTGVKLSYDRFIGSIDYQFNQNYQYINLKLFYAFLITHRCPKKRINEINKLDFSQF